MRKLRVTFLNTILILVTTTVERFVMSMVIGIAWPGT